MAEIINNTYNEKVLLFLAQSISMANEDGIEVPIEVGKEISVELKINGVEVPFTRVLDYLASAWDDEVKKDAAILVKEKLKLSNLLDLVDKYQWEIDQKIRETFGLPLED